MTPNELITARQTTHGDFTDNSAVAQQIKTIIRNNPAKLTQVQAEALDFIASKIGRICSGNANERDHWLDIAGYATLAADRIPNTQPGLCQLPPLPTGWRIMLQEERIDTLSRVFTHGVWMSFSAMLLGKLVKTHYEECPAETVITPDWHNPCNVESPGEGYRFLLKGEKPPEDAELSTIFHDWKQRGCPGSPLCSRTTYRTKCPLPTIS